MRTRAACLGRCWRSLVRPARDQPRRFFSLVKLADLPGLSRSSSWTIKDRGARSSGGHDSSKSPIRLELPGRGDAGQIPRMQNTTPRWSSSLLLLVLLVLAASAACIFIRGRWRLFFWTLTRAFRPFLLPRFSRYIVVRSRRTRRRQEEEQGRLAAYRRAGYV